MLHRLAALCSIAALSFGAFAQSSRSMNCFVVIEEGASAEGNALFLQKMGVEPETLKSFAPSRFTRADGVFSASAQGDFAYQAESPVLVERLRGLALYQVPVKIRAPAPPRAAKKVDVIVLLSDLKKEGGIVQPAFRAMDLAAASAGWTSGSAWIIEMKSVGKGKLKAVVGLAR